MAAGSSLHDEPTANRESAAPVQRRPRKAGLALQERPTGSAHGSAASVARISLMPTFEIQGRRPKNRGSELPCCVTLLNTAMRRERRGREISLQFSEPWRNTFGFVW